MQVLSGANECVSHTDRRFTDERKHKSISLNKSEDYGKKKTKAALIA